MKSLLLLVLFAAPVLADDDFETRYHDAYVKEVVDGETAVAAKAYLNLLRERDLPTHLKAQCRLRFAVTCVLLGRSDEARARLAAMAVDPDTPKNLLPQIAEYRKSIKDVGPGRALDKRLEELKFKLGRGDADAVGDFLIIGKPAIPFLLDLLKHSNADLRNNAFAVLCQMNVPGLTALWQADYSTGHMYWEADRNFARHLKKNPDEMRLFEKRLRELPTNVISKKLASFSSVPYSIAFLDAIAVRPRLAEQILDGLEARPQNRETMEFADRWIRDGSDTLAQLLVVYFAETANTHPLWAKHTELFPILCRKLPHKTPARARIGIGKMAAFATPEDRMAIVEERVNAGKPDDIADAVASAIDASGKFDAQRYAAVLKTWHKLKIGRPGLHIHAALARLPDDQRTAWATQMFRESAWEIRSLGFSTARDLPLILAALKEASAKTATTIATRAFDSVSVGGEIEYARGIARIAPQIARHVSSEDLIGFGTDIRRAITTLPDDEAYPVALALIKETMTRVGANRMQLPVAFVTTRTDWDAALETRYRKLVASRLLEVISKEYGGDCDGDLFNVALAMLISDANRYNPLGDARARVVTFMKSRLRYIPLADEGNMLDDLVHLGDTIPLQDWLPYADTGEFLNMDRPTIPVADRAARAIAENPGELSYGVYEFLRTRVTPTVRDETIDRLFREANNTRLHSLVEWLRKARPSGATLEATMIRLLATEDANLADLVQVGRYLARERPTRALYPLVRKALASNDDAVVIAGIEIVESLGQDDLAADLSGLLDSLNPAVRKRATTALDNLAKLREMKEITRSFLPDK